MVELGNQQILLLSRLLRCGDIANEGRCPSSVPSVQRNTTRRQRQHGETRQRARDRHQARWYGGASHYYRRIAHDRCCSHRGEVMAKDRERKEQRTLETLK